MSQYPYQPPQQVPYGYGYYPQNPMDVLLAPAKRASVIMLVLGGLMLPCGLLIGAMGGAADFSQLPPENAAQLQALEQQLQGLGWSLNKLLAFVGGILAVPGLILVVLGVVVRRGGLGSVVTSIIFCGLLALLAGVSVVGGLVQGAANAAGGAVLWGVILLLMIATLVFLFQAARNAGQVAAYRMGTGMQPYPPQGYVPPQYPSQQPQNWQQSAGGWGQGQWGAAPGQQPPPPQYPPQQNWQPPPPPPPPPSDEQR